MHTATYSPEDNKLRLYPACRLDAEEYERVKAAGFSWAPKQGLFVAPMWTPAREDLLIEFCGEIGDEDTSLVDRAEQRADRFEDYSDKRAADYAAAHKAVASIADNIPLGQPILVGHHSERHARRDAERIENGMHKAVKMWETAQYWTSRASGAIRHAKYKELPGVRYRRIKGIEADQRKQQRSKSDAEKWLKLWTRDGLTIGQARGLADLCWLTVIRDAAHPYGLTAADVLKPDGERPPQYPSWTAQQVQDYARSSYMNTITHCERWISHTQNRLAYERAMLDEGGGLKGEQFDYKPGGRILRRGEWLVVTKVNRRGGVVSSVSVLGHWSSSVSVDEIREYREPEAGDAEKVAAVTKALPICNYPGEGFRGMTNAEWTTRNKWSDFPYIKKVDATETAGAHRRRQMPGAKHWEGVPVFITDAKRIDPPTLKSQAEPIAFTRKADPQPKYIHRDETPAAVTAMRQAVRQGVQVVTAPQLFPTPAPLAARMVELAGIRDGDRVLEPSAGTGNILAAIGQTRVECKAVAVELSRPLADKVAARFMVNVDVRCMDFLACNGDLGSFDRILMNPPFANAQDIAHIKHALGMLKPGGRLVAICANGPRQTEQLRPLVEQRGGTWEELPPATFAESGTSVRAVLLTI